MINTRISDERGILTPTTLIFLVLLMVAGYASSRVLPIYSQRAAFEEQLLHIAGQATLQRWDDRKIMHEVIDVARDSSFELGPEDIHIRRTPYRSEIIIETTYRKSVQLPGGRVHTFRFDFAAAGLQGL